MLRERLTHLPDNQGERKQPERFLLILEAIPNKAPAIIRLRRFLKMALRSFGLKCITVTEQKQ